MRRFSVLRATFTVLMAWSFLAPGLARERGPRVEVICPSPPIPVTIENSKVFVYELHLTNFDTVPLTLKRIEVSANPGSTDPFFTLEGSKLSSAMVRVGAKTSSDSANSSSDTSVIDPGGRNIVYVWIELPANHAVPLNLKHRMIFTSTPAGATNPSDATLQDFEVPVSREPTPTLSPPFAGGIWVAGDGPANDSNHRRSTFAIDGHIYSPERFAVDWVKVGSNGDSRHDGATENENWWDWGEPVLAVADGEVTEAVDEFPDNTPRVLPPVTLDNLAGNHVILRISEDRFVTYAHLQKGSIKVHAGDHVHRGDVIGLLGNSGNSTGAHLHLQVTNSNSVLQTQGVPFTFANFTYLGPGSDYPEKQVSQPWTNSIPPGNGVLKFAASK